MTTRIPMPAPARASTAPSSAVPATTTPNWSGFGNTSAVSWRRPQAAPRPRRLRTRWPNPVSSLLTVFRLNLPGGIGKLPFFRVLRVIMFPAFFIWMLGHQLSQLLSYEGRFQGHPPRQRRIRLGSLLALIGYNLLPLLYTPLWVWPLFAWLDNQDPWLPWHWLRSWL